MARRLQELDGEPDIRVSDLSDAAPVDPASWSYRPHIDGLRTVAVYLVVAFHAGIGRASGGFIGVDVFFVLSGYLVTGLLLRDIDSSRPARLSRFYSRRIRRLLPAAAVNLIVTAIVFRAIASPLELPSAIGSIRAAALYVSNWWFIHDSTNYFGSSVDASPVAQYWSLSVEEQFYVIWPLLLGGMALLVRRFGRRRRAALTTLCAALGAVSLAACLLMASDEPNRAYFGTFTRAYQLLAGALIAMAPWVITRLGRQAGLRRMLPVVGLVLLGSLVAASSSWLTVGPMTRGVIATVITVGLIVSLEASAGGVAKGLLSLGPLTFLGRISYGTYLWHWIVVLVATRQLHMAPVTTLAVTIPVATGLAALSYTLVERPIRTSRRLDGARWPVIACGLVGSALLGLVVIPWLLDDSGSSERTTASPAAATQAGTPVTVDWKAASKQEPDLEPCDLQKTQVCQITKGKGPRVLLVGESHAAMLAPALEAVAQQRDLNLAVAYLSYCPWVRGIRYTILSPHCFEEQEEMFTERIPAYDPDVVILAHRSVDDVRNPMGLADEDVGPLYLPKQTADQLDKRVNETVAGLRKQGRKVVIIEPIPASRPADTPLTCLSKTDVVESCRFTTSSAPTAEERAFRALDADHDDVWSFNVDQAVCPFLPVCDPVVKGKIVMYDSTHLTTGSARTLSGTFDQYLVDNGIIPAE